MNIPEGLPVDFPTSSFKHSLQKEWRQGSTLGILNSSRQMGQVSSSFRPLASDLEAPLEAIAELASSPGPWAGPGNEAITELTSENNLKCTISLPNAPPPCTSVISAKIGGQQYTIRHNWKQVLETDMSVKTVIVCCCQQEQEVHSTHPNTFVGQILTYNN